MNNLTGKTALVTGSAKNLGRAIAIDLAKQGAKVAINYHTDQIEAGITLKEVQKYSKGIMVQADICSQKEVFSMIEKTTKEIGSIDILINLVGNFIYEPIANTTFEKFRNTIETNLYSVFLTSKYVLPGMVKKNWGRIINFGNVGAENIQVREKTTPYLIAKTGVIMLTKLLAHEYTRYGITVNSISPGILETSMAKPPTPTEKYIQLQDILNAVNFFLSEESSSVNGANLEVAGGFRLGFS